MRIISEINRLERLIANCYFSNKRKQLLHFYDCRIYSAERPFCSCGLLYRLEHLDFTLAGIVYPKFWDELYLQDTGEWPKKNNRKRKKEMEEGMKILEEVFGKLKRPSLEEIKMEYDDMYKALNSVFSPRMFPSAFKRLEKWLKDEISKEY